MVSQVRGFVAKYALLSFFIALFAWAMFGTVLALRAA
jgi:hypothetical protein